MKSSFQGAPESLPLYGADTLYSLFNEEPDFGWNLIKGSWGAPWFGRDLMRGQKAPAFCLHIRSPPIQGGYQS